MRLILLTLAACALSTGGVDRSKSDALATVQRKFDAFNRHDAEAIERLYAADAHLHGPDYPDLAGSKPIADTYRRIFSAIPDAKDSVVLLERTPERVYAQFVLVGHFGGAQDKPISARIISVYRVTRDQIVEDDTYYDRKP